MFTTFSKICIFHPLKFLMTFSDDLFLVIDSELVISPLIFEKTVDFPLFRQKRYISPYFGKIYMFYPIFLISPLDFIQFTCFCLLYVFFASPNLTMMHLCIIQCTYWTPLSSAPSKSKRPTKGCREAPTLSNER